MFDVHITFPLAQFHAMVSAFEGQFEAQQEEVAILDFGCSYKQELGYIVLEWEDEVDEAFIDQLYADGNILDFTICCASYITDDQFSLLEQVL